MSDAMPRVLKILQSLSGRKAQEVSPDESLFDAEVLDSFALPELVSALEAEFGIKIPDADLSAQTFESVNRITAYVEKRVRG